jgi:hypothetical protein
MEAIESGKSSSLLQCEIDCSRKKYYCDGPGFSQDKFANIKIPFSSKNKFTIKLSFFDILDNSFS